MEQEPFDGYSASFRNLELRTWEANQRHCWSVNTAETAEPIASGEAVDLASAMVRAAEAAAADWGSVKWRRRGGESDEPAEWKDEPQEELS